MMTLYCECETPLMDVEHDEGCRRCGRPVNFTPDEPLGYVPDEMDGGEYEEPSDECGISITVGPSHDPYATHCDLKPGHAGPHQGGDPFGNDFRVEWEGGGSCMGDPLPVRNMRELRESERFVPGTTLTVEQHEAAEAAAFAADPVEYDVLKDDAAFEEANQLWAERNPEEAS